MSKALTIMINLIVITLILSQMDPYGNQLAQEYLGLYVAAGLLALLTLGLLLPFIDQHVLGAEDEEKHDPIMPEVRDHIEHRDWTNPTIERLKKEMKQ